MIQNIRKVDQVREFDLVLRCSFQIDDVANMFAFIAKNINVTTWLDQSVNA
jgi:hypothetical protein